MNLIPEHTQIPNVYLDIVMPDISPAEFKVLMAISRLTFGWQKTGDHISVNQIMKMTALSGQGVMNCLKVLEKRQLIIIDRGDWQEHKANYYRINLDWTPNSVSLNSVERDSFNSVERETSSSFNSVEYQKKALQRKKENGPSERPNASNEAPPKTLDPKLKAIADQIYRIDTRKFAPLIRWIKAAERNYSVRVLIATLERFLPYAARIDGNWWPYLDKILDKTEGDLNASDHEKEHERNKREEGEWAKLHRGSILGLLAGGARQGEDT